MAHRTHYPDEAMYSEVKRIYGHMTGAAAADLEHVSGDVLVADRTDTGDFTLTFKHKYPQGVMPHKPNVVGTTEGLTATFKTWDPAAGTATVTFTVGNTPTDPAATDEIYFAFDVRNSGRNPDAI